MTRRERLEAKAQRRREWAESRTRRAEIDAEKADLSEEKSGIPFGQPILAGHHSQRRHQNAIDRSHRAMTRSIESEKMAEYHEEKAEGIERQLANTIFSDDPDAAQQIEAKIARLEHRCERIKLLNKGIKAAAKAGYPDGWLKSLGATDVELVDIARNLQANGSPNFQPYHTSNPRAEIRRLKQRLMRLEH